MVTIMHYKGYLHTMATGEINQTKMQKQLKYGVSANANTKLAINPE